MEMTVRSTQPVSRGVLSFLLPALASLCLAWGSVAAAGSLWPEFRGPGGIGIAPGGKAPLHWSETENITWKTPLPGRGWSSPVLADGQVYMTTAIEVFPTEEEAQQLYARKGTDPDHIKARQIAKSITLKLLVVDQKSGELMETATLFEIEEPDAIHRFNSYASPTPVIDGDHLFCHFGTFGTACVDRGDLSIVWERKIPLEHAVGPGSSPFIHGDLLVLICDGVDEQYVTALDKKNGSDVWRTDRPPMDTDDGDKKKSYDTPIAVTDRLGREQLICMGSQWVVAYEPATGEELWKVRHGTGFSVVPRPVVGHGMVYISTGYGKAQLWAIRIDGTGDVTDTHVVWTETRRIPTKPSPLLVGDELYVIDDGGVATCFNAHDGTVHWTGRIGGNHTASPLYADGRIYFSSQEGTVTVIRPGTEFEILAENELEGQLMASPLLADEALFLRSDTALYRIDATEQARARSVSSTD